MTAPATAAPSRDRTAALLAAGAFLAALTLYAHPLLYSVLSQDDFQILAQSWTWQKTVDGLWTPNNEHAMPLGRLLTFVAVQLAGRPTALPFACVLAGVLGLGAGMGLAYHFVRRELGHPLYGLTALILFGVSSVYQQAVYWFAASFSVYALDTLLLALLAGQRYRQTGRTRWLLACGVFCALAPCWFASGVLAGPFCCFYLLCGEGPTGRTLRSPDTTASRRVYPAGTSPAARLGFVTFGARLVSGLLRLTPLLGTAAFLAVSLPRTAPIIQHLEHYNGATAVEAFRPLTGAQFTARSVVDNLALGVFGVWWVTVGLPVALVVLAVLAVVGAWWVRRSPRRRLALLGVAMIFGSYLLIYSARALWDYDVVEMQSPTWCRYHLQPQLGLALLVVGGLPGWEGRWFRLDPTGRLTPRQAWTLAWLLGFCFLIQAPRGLVYYPPNPTQALTLSLIERASRYCQERHISADAARRELGVLAMPESTTVVNGWEFLRGSDQPRDWSPEEIREMLDAAR